MRHHLQTVRAFVHIIAIASMLLLLVLAGFAAVPVTGQSNSAALSQASVQPVRCAAMTANDLVLLYRPTTEHAQAISSLQVALPLFEQEQQTLLANPDTEVQWLLQQARPDYLAMVQAEQEIIAHPNDAQLATQVTIVLAHERGYLLTMNQLVFTLQQQDDAQLTHLFWIETGIVFILLIIAGIASTVVSRTLGQVSTLPAHQTLPPQKEDQHHGHDSTDPESKPL